MADDSPMKTIAKLGVAAGLGYLAGLPPDHRHRKSWPRRRDQQHRRHIGRNALAAAGITIWDRTSATT